MGIKGFVAALALVAVATLGVVAPAVADDVVEPPPVETVDAVETAVDGTPLADDLSDPVEPDTHGDPPAVDDAGGGQSTPEALEAKNTPSTGDAGVVDADALGEEAAPDALSAPPAVMAVAADEPTEPPRTSRAISWRYNDNDNNGTMSLGDAVDYELLVTNLGSLPLTVEYNGNMPTDACIGLVIPAGGVGECRWTEPMETWYVGAQNIQNSPSLSGRNDAGEYFSVAADVWVTVGSGTALELTGDLHLIDLAEDGIGIGDEVVLTATARNVGDDPITDLVVKDYDLGTLLCSDTTVAPGAEVTCVPTARYFLTDNHLANGTVGAWIDASGRVGTVVVRAWAAPTVTLPFSPSFMLDVESGTTDSDGDEQVSAGDDVFLRFTFSNSGNVPLHNLRVTVPGLTATCPWGQLPVQRQAVCYGSRPITGSDIDAGAVTLGYTAEVGAGNSNYTDTVSGESRVPLRPSLEIHTTARTPDGSTPRVDGTLQFDFEVVNASGVDVSGVTLTSAELGAIDCASGTIATDATVTCAAQTAVTITDRYPRQITVGVTATGFDPEGAPVSSSATVTTPFSGEVDGLTSLSASAIDEDGDGRLELGESIRYDYAYTSLTQYPNSSPRDTLDLVRGCHWPTVPVGTPMTCSRLYRVTAADVARGWVSNKFALVGWDSNASEPSTVLTSIFRGDTLTASVSRFLHASPSGPRSGDILTVQFHVNSPNVVAVSNVTLTTNRGQAACGSTTLAPRTSTTCTLQVALTQADLDARMITVSGTPSGLPSSGPAIVGEPVATKTVVDAVSSIEVASAAGVPADSNGNGRMDAGETIRFEHTVTNTGATTARNIGVSDATVALLSMAGQPPLPRTGPISVSCGVTSLAPGNSTVCVENYVITQGDVDSGEITREFSATAAGGVPSTSTPPVLTTIAQVPEIDSTVTAAEAEDVDGDSSADAGDRVRFALVVTNSGNVTLTGITASSAHTGFTCPSVPVAPGGSVTCEADDWYTITEEDAAAGSITLEATIAADPPIGGPISAQLAFAGLPSFVVEEEPTAPATDGTANAAGVASTHPSTGALANQGVGPAGLALLLGGFALLLGARRRSRMRR